MHGVVMRLWRFDMANFPTDDVLGIDKGERDEIKAELIRMRQYVMRKGLGIGDCVAWCKIKERFGIGIRDVDDEQWLNDYESRKKADDWPPPCRHGVKGPCGECRA